MPHRSYTYDNTLLLKAAGAITASAAVATILDTNNGASGDPSFWKADVVCDVTAMDVASTDELYDIIVQLSNSATFASGVQNRAGLPLGVARAGSDANTIGRFVITVDNEYDGVLYRYVRLYTLIAAASTTPSINYKAFAAINVGGM